MENSTKTPLKVLSASAGSGKTYSLVQNYLKLTLGDNIENRNFANILAMTFTNKAAWEMKKRVIEALDKLAYGSENKDPEDKKEALDLLKQTKKNTQLEETRIIQGAKHVLSSILHNYDKFSLLTIDKFSLQLIRTFSKDLDLDENFKVTLDQKLLLEQVIDELLSKIGKKGNERITRLATQYAKSNIDNGNKWNFRKSLIQFSQIITKESDQKYVDTLIKQDFKEESFRTICDELSSITTQHKKMVEDTYHYFKSLNSTADDYPRKSKGIFSFLNTLDQRKIIPFQPLSESNLKTLEGSNVKPIHNVDKKLMQEVKNIVAYEEKHLDRVYTLQKLKTNFYNLSLLGYISNELKSYQKRENIIGIFEFGQKIAELIGKENALYVYERLGNRYKNYLLDEFQDTSRLQWLNLIPLVHESLSTESENLIVGDPKQAIYRFRNGLVDQFVALPGIYNPELNPELNRKSDFFQQMGKKEVLKNNYRSSEEIVKFNNGFFSKILDFLPQHFKEYYSDIKQNPIEGQGGYAEINFIKPDAKGNDLKEKEEKFLLQKVEKCISDGYDPIDICVLTRKNREGVRFAKFLTENGYTVVTSDSLTVSSDRVVQLCIDYFRLRQNSTNKTAQIKFATSFYQVMKKDPITQLAPFWIDEKVGNFNFDKFVATEFQSAEKLFFSYENLYDLTKKFIRLINQSELTNPYLHHLMEILQDFDLINGPSISTFLEDWEAKLNESNIQLPESKDAIRVMTIHKSKGLEFPVVILPNISFAIKPHKGTFFVELDNEKLVYTALKKVDAPQRIIDRYNEEYQQLLLDELNTLYVAFTRPKKRLYAITKTSLSSTGYITKMSQPVSLALKEMTVDIPFDRTDTFLSVGKEEKIKKEKREEKTPFQPANIENHLWFPDVAFREKESLEKEILDSQQLKGTQLHYILAESIKTNIVKKAVEKGLTSGKISIEWKDELIQTAEKVRQLLQNQSFYTEAKKVITEQAIVINEKDVKRPDVIFLNGNKATIVDYKSGIQSSSHIKQVKEYCLGLLEMGYEDASGYLVYTQPLELKQVV